MTICTTPTTLGDIRSCIPDGYLLSFIDCDGSKIAKGSPNAADIRFIIHHNLRTEVKYLRLDCRTRTAVIRLA